MANYYILLKDNSRREVRGVKVEVIGECLVFSTIDRVEYIIPISEIKFCERTF